MQSIPSLFIAPSPLGGRGVFTAAPIPQGALLEICPVIVLPGQDRQHLDRTGLYDYYFIWGEEDELCAIALGYGSLYNHSFQPNAEYRADFDGPTLDFYALRDVEAGEEITVNYNGDPDNREALWFNARQLGGR
ncbi:MAG: SET domain-containing protein-lysine N-methyltransferase [Lewinellaceae bacterium]|nr:SET domain-containing protein-lysine N-methyltransferase [Lewinellaceae bacterium]